MPRTKTAPTRIVGHVSRLGSVFVACSLLGALGCGSGSDEAPVTPGPVPSGGHCEYESVEGRVRIVNTGVDEAGAFIEAEFEADEGRPHADTLLYQRNRYPAPCEGCFSEGGMEVGATFPTVAEVETAGGGCAPIQLDPFDFGTCGCD